MLIEATSPSQLESVLLEDDRRNRAAFAAAKVRLDVAYKSWSMLRAQRIKDRGYFEAREKLSLQLQDLCADLSDCLNAFTWSPCPISIERNALRAYLATKRLQVENDEFVDGYAADRIERRERILESYRIAEEEKAYDSFRRLFGQHLVKS